VKVSHTVVLLFLANIAFGQTIDEVKPKICFQLTDSVNQKPVANAHIINLNSKKGTISDPLGYFKIPVEICDTLIITALGYKEFILTITNTFIAQENYYNLVMVPISYKIEAVTITRYKSYYNFIKDVATREIPLTEEEQRIEKLTHVIKDVNTDSLIMPEQSPYEIPYLKIVGKTFYFGEDWYSKQRKKIDQKVDLSKKAERLNDILSAEGIERYTGLKGTDAIEFLTFCNFSEKFLENATEYDVLEALLEKQKEYNAKAQK
jgi:hypothetical protein